MRILPLLPLFVLVSGPAFGQLGGPPVPSENPITPEKALLGKVLFWDEQLSSDSSIACGTCHVPGVGGIDPRAGAGSTRPGPDGVYGTEDDIVGSRGIARTDLTGQYEPDPVTGFEPQITARLSNPSVGAAHFDELFWDGRATSAFIDPETGATSIAAGGALESQALAPILSSVEMGQPGRTWDDVRAKLADARPLALAWNLTPDLLAGVPPGTTYPDLFTAAFGDPALTAERIAFALATYQRTLNPDGTPWDRFMNGQPGTLTSGQIAGMNLFNGTTARCSQCHPAPLFSDGSYRNLGLRPIAEDIGRQAVTGNFDDRGKFKVPSLRNAALRPRFMHNGSLTSVISVITFYDNGGGGFPENKDPLMNGLSLTIQQRLQLEDFVFFALTDSRVANELPPFDRPRLNSERANPTPVSLGGGIAGAGGFLPLSIAHSPAHIGHPGFRIGLQGATGGAFARLGLGAAPPGTPGTHLSYPNLPQILSGVGAGEGYGTWLRPIPPVPALVGSVLFAEWTILDPAAAGGRAKSDVLQLMIL